MLNISMVRVDERLVHGQIIIKWIEAKEANRIVIIDDEVACDPIMREFLKLTLPKDIELGIYTLKEGAEFLKTNNSEDKVIVLAKYLWVVKGIYEKGVRIQEVNIGRIPSDIGKKKVHPNIFLNEEDINVVNYFRKKGVSVVIQLVPDNLPANVYDLIINSKS